MTRVFTYVGIVPHLEGVIWPFTGCGVHVGYSPTSVHNWTRTGALIFCIAHIARTVG